MLVILTLTLSTIHCIAAETEDSVIDPQNDTEDSPDSADNVLPTDNPFFGPTVRPSRDLSELGEFSLVGPDGSPVGCGHQGLLLYKNGTVCDDDFSYNSAHAICRRMGYGRAYGWGSSMWSVAWPIQHNYNITLDDVYCINSDMAYCQWTETDNCFHEEDVLITCSCDVGRCSNRFSLIDERGQLVNNEKQGLLMYQGEATVCDDEFSWNSAHAICSMMGFSAATNWTNGVLWPALQLMKPTGLDNVNCSTTHFNNCSYSVFHNCWHSEDVFLTCSGHSSCGSCPDIVCPPGNRNVEGSCEACPANTYSPDLNSGGTCISCPGPSTSPSGSDKCVCRDGTQWSNGVCSFCIRGHVSDPEHGCVRCPAGTTTPDGNVCSCKDGEYWLKEISTCVPCSPGSYKKGDMLTCEPCIQAFRSVLTFPAGASYCTCESGEYWDTDTRLSSDPPRCTECGQNKASDIGAQECLLCEAGTSTVDHRTCSCPGGHIWTWTSPNTGSCTPCLADTYKHSSQSLPCTPCPVNSTARPGAATCTCQFDMFFDYSSSECKGCHESSTEYDIEVCYQHTLNAQTALGNTAVMKSEKRVLITLIVIILVLVLVLAAIGVLYIRRNCTAKDDMKITFAVHEDQQPRLHLDPAEQAPVYPRRAAAYHVTTATATEVPARRGDARAETPVRQAVQLSPRKQTWETFEDAPASNVYSNPVEGESVYDTGEPVYSTPQGLHSVI